MPDVRTASLVQLQYQQIASQSSQTAQLKARSEMMAGGGNDPTLQRVEDGDLLQGKFAVDQLADDEELLQGKSAPVQRVVEDELLQGKLDTVQHGWMRIDRLLRPSDSPTLFLRAPCQVAVPARCLSRLSWTCIRLQILEVINDIT